MPGETVLTRYQPRRRVRKEKRLIAGAADSKEGAEEPSGEGIEDDALQVNSVG